MNRTISAVILGLGLLGGSMVSMGQVQNVPMGGTPFGQALQPAAADAKKADVNIPAGVTLEQAVEVVRKAMPEFNAVIVRAEGSDKERPILPAIQLRNATAAEIADVLSRVIDKTVVTTNGNAYFFHVVPDDANGPTVKVFALMDQAKATGPKGLDSAVSLVKAALDQAGGPKPVLQVHEATCTLIVKGTRDQIEVVQGAINALVPPPEVVEVIRHVKELEERSARQQVELNETREQLRQKTQQLSSLEALERDNQQLRERAITAEKQGHDQAREMVRLQAQVDELHKRLNPKQ